MSRPDRPSKSMRLNRYLAAAGLGSRRKVEEYILEGRISVDGEDVYELSHTVDPDNVDVRFDDERVRLRRKEYYILNKPVGYLCTHRDPQGRPRAIDLLPNADQQGLFTVGRLDETSSGLLVVTNDGELANRLAHPRYQVKRSYRVQVAGVPTPETLKELKQGIYFSEGKFRVTSARRLKTWKNSAFVEVELRQGRNREIRRLFARVGHKVMALERVAFGPVTLGDLAPGAFRKLSRQEVQELIDYAAKFPADRDASTPSHRGRPGNRKTTTGGRREKPASRRGGARSHGGRSRSQQSSPARGKRGGRRGGKR